jgi:hypothetical protein
MYIASLGKDEKDSLMYVYMKHTTNGLATKFA